MNILSGSGDAELTQTTQHALALTPCLEAMQAEFRRVFSDRSNMGEEMNPINLINPGYETVWRVVLRIVLEIQYRERNEVQLRELWVGTLEHFLNAEKLNRVSFGNAQRGVSAENIVREGLRLYPPTRRVYRKLERDGQLLETRFDIEHAHRAEWEHGYSFDPARWVGVPTKAIKERYMPFSVGYLRCPAEPNAGPMMIGILSAVIARGLRKRGIKLVPEDRESKEALTDDEPLHQERESYQKLFLANRA